MLCIPENRKSAVYNGNTRNDQCFSVRTAAPPTYSTISILNATISEKTRSNGALCISSVLDAQLFHHFDSTRISAIESDMIREIVASMPPNAICSTEICCPFTKVITVNIIIKKKGDHLFFRLPSATIPTNPMLTRAKVGDSGTGFTDGTVTAGLLPPSYESDISIAYGVLHVMSL